MLLLWFFLTFLLIKWFDLKTFLSFCLAAIEIFDFIWLECCVCFVCSPRVYSDRIGYKISVNAAEKYQRKYDSRSEPLCKWKNNWRLMFTRVQKSKKKQTNKDQWLEGDLQWHSSYICRLGNIRNTSNLHTKCVCNRAYTSDEWLSITSLWNISSTHNTVSVHLEWNRADYPIEFPLNTHLHLVHRF